ncbi:hypothetical protein M4D50_01145 [Rothia sp. p3-SID1597]|nr:hypothetical protein [Rothia sp. p3-SID1597]
MTQPTDLHTATIKPTPSYTITIPIGTIVQTKTPKGATTTHKLRWINANQKQHWGDSSPQVRSWRAAAAQAAKDQAIPALQYAEIHGYIIKTTARRYDPTNLAPTMKAIVDGLVTNYGLLPDDDYKHLDGPHVHHGMIDRTGPERIEVRIFDKENPNA